MAEKRAEPMIIKDKDEMRKWSRLMRSQGKTICCVPTMGYLHKGHISLVEEAKKLADLIVVSIYVNPSQFAPSEDLSTYPSDFNGDIQKLTACGGVDVVFNPDNLYDYGEISSSTTSNDNEGVRDGNCGKKLVCCVEDRKSGHETWVRVEKLERGMCGRSRPIFFRGLANIMEPDVGVFGKKDYQQCQIIRRFVSKIFHFLL